MDAYEMDELIYRFDSADEAIAFLSYYLFDKRTEVILETVITNLQRENRRLNSDVDHLHDRISELELQLLRHISSVDAHN